MKEKEEEAVSQIFKVSVPEAGQPGVEAPAYGDLHLGDRGRRMES